MQKYPDLPDRLEADRVFIQRYKQGDGEGLFALLERNDNRTFLQPNVEEVAILTTVNEAEAKVRRHAAEWVARERFVLGIWLKSEALYVGEIWIEPQRWEVPSFELGWFLDQGFQGRGLATEAARRSLVFLFSDLKAHKVIVITRDTNLRSAKLAERLGFTKEGHLRECRVEKGIRYGHIYYGLLQSEFTSE
ncbi:MAG: GNAT family N-acetyltransferase [Candidatus Hodarchaeota archaeon]